MVSITVFVEGGGDTRQLEASVSQDEISNIDVNTLDNSELFREGFHKLFCQKIPENKVNLIIHPIGSITIAKKYLSKIIAKNLKAVLLIDLDEPKTKKAQRLSSTFGTLDTKPVFFMIQRMEAWILSQPDRIDRFAEERGWIRKKRMEELVSYKKIHGIHPEDISDPDDTLYDFLKKFYAVKKIRNGKTQEVSIKYQRSKDGPELIGYLDLNVLMDVFDEAKNLVLYIENQL